MSKWLRLVAAQLVVIALILPARAQSPEILDADKKIIELAKQSSPLMDNLEYLSDRIGPRLTGSERLRTANDWTAQKMREYGLENVHLESWTIPIGWERGTVEARILEPNGLPVFAAARAWAPNTHGTITGPVVFLDVKPDNSDLDRYKGKLKNAIVLMSRPANVNEHPSRVDPNANRRGIFGTDEVEESAEQPTEQRQQANARYQFLKNEGAAVLLNDAGKPQMLLNMTGSWSTPGSNSNAFPSLFVAHEHFAMLHRLLARGLPVTMQVKIENRFRKGPITVYNTVGEIRGSEKPDEIVICGAHLDSWDLGTGSVDNGTGSMTVLEAARLIKALGAPPKRTIRFVLFTGEEQGLYGSREYVKQHKSELDKVSAVFVHDTGTGKVNGIGLHGNKQLQPFFEKEQTVLKDLGVERYNDFLMGGTDHASFYADRVPAFWFMQDPADYGWMHHSQSDTFDKALPDDLIQGATVMAICAYNVAQLPEMLERRPAPAEPSK